MRRNHHAAAIAVPVLHVLDTGPLTTIQDAGRFGLRAFGVSQSGPMDRLAFDMANLLVSNPPNAAAIEFASFGGRFRFDADAVVAVTGPGVEISIDGVLKAPHQALKIRAGQNLRIGPVRTGLWGYLAVAGGIDTPVVLGARATHLRFGLGGIEGRALVGGDCLPLAGTDTAPPMRVADLAPPETDRSPIRVILGPQDDYFDPAATADFLSNAYRVSTRLDRMATFLDGPSLTATRGHDIISDGTLPGAIQVPGSGQPLILMADGQTTGGYPKIATIIGADLRRVAQTPPGQALWFEAVSANQAETALLECRDWHREVLNSVRTVEYDPSDTARLLGANLISGIWDRETGNE